MATPMGVPTIRCALVMLLVASIIIEPVRIPMPRPRPAGRPRAGLLYTSAACLKVFCRLMLCVGNCAGVLAVSAYYTNGGLQLGSFRGEGLGLRSRVRSFGFSVVLAFARQL